MIKKFFFYNHKYFYLILLSLILHLVAAYFSQGFYEQDEHFSILEPITFKLGENATLGWDFFFHYDKQWFLSFFYFYLIKFLNFINISSPFQWAFVIRLISSILGWLSILCLIHFTIKQLSNQNLIKPLFFISSLFWFYPYIHARAASENMSIIFLIFGITIFSFFRKNKKFLFLCGILLGLSFSIRFTNIFILGCFGLWALFFKKVNIIDSLILIISFLIVFIFSILIDYWGYGFLFPNNSLVVLNYFILNREWASSGYFDTGTDAWWYNFYFILKEFLPPVSIFVIISLILFWFFNPKKMLTWLTLPYFIFLCTIPHKETRFLFPILMFTPYFLIMVTDRFYKSKKNILLILKDNIFTKIIIFITISVNCFALILLSITPANNATLLYKFLYENENSIKKIYTINKIPYRKSDLLINFYGNKNIHFVKITSQEECNKIGDEIITINNKPINNFDKETIISEIQKFSYPKWTFDYSILCNLDTYFNKIYLSEKTYYLTHKFKYLDFFENNENFSCKRIYSSLPKFLTSFKYRTLFKNLSSWHVFECDSV